MPTEAERQAAEAAERAAAAEKTRRESATKGVDERLAARDESVKEFYEREKGVKPTPTQRENDLAKVGALDIDAKEPDGSEPDDEAQRRVMSARLPGQNPYDVRAMPAPARKGEQEEPRRTPTSSAAPSTTPSTTPSAAPSTKR